MWSPAWGEVLWGGGSVAPVPIDGSIRIFMLCLLLLSAGLMAFRLRAPERIGTTDFVKLGLGLFVVIPVFAFASTVAPLNEFSNGQIADAIPVNENFDSITSAINDNDSRLVQLETAPSPPTGTSCLIGSFVTGFDAAGNPLCGVATGDISQVTAGSGLSGGGATGAVDLSIAPLGVTSNFLAFGSVTNFKLGALAVSNSKLADGAVTTEKLSLPNVSFDTGVPVQIASGSDVTLGGGGELLLGFTASDNVAMDRNEIQARTNGQVAQLRLNFEGGPVRARQVTLTALPDLAAQDTALQVTGIRDAELDGGGQLMLGNFDASNVVFDDNEIQSRDDGAAAELRINFEGGNVRFGGEAYVPALHVTGGADLAEHFDVVDDEYGEVLPGDVLCIDVDRPGQLRRCQQALDRSVAGIVSGAGGVRSGMLMGQPGTKAHGEVAVALTGRVYVHADARHGGIRPGDILTTSDTPGYAMRAADPSRAAGALLGKAMTPLEEGRGLVLVLVALQ